MAYLIFGLLTMRAVLNNLNRIFHRFQQTISPFSKLVIYFNQFILLFLLLLVQISLLLPYFVHIIESSNKIQHNHDKTENNYNLCFSLHFLQKLMCFSFVPCKLKVWTEVSQSQGLSCAILITFMQMIKTKIIN